MKKYQNLINLIDKRDTFLLTSHVSPDGDSIGSLLGLKYLLEPYAKEIDIILADPVPEYLRFLNGTDDIHLYEELDFKMNKKDYDLYFTLDCGTLERIGEVQQLISADEKIINIDHHGDNNEYGVYNYVDSTVSATGELIYNLAIELGSNYQVDFGMAITTAIITDTGNFKYSNTSSETHRIIADMLELGVDTQKIIKQVYGTESYSSLRLKGEALNNLQIAAQQQIAWISINQETLDHLGATWEDTEGLVNYPRSLKDVEVGILFKEVGFNKTRVSFRSNTYFPVDEFAHEFGGGGHSRAAGCTIQLPLIEAEELVIDKLESKF
ncbi:DHH family phosphoesterase [Selenihalanaerobacter shriftii]|uniref:Phosphoesterase RecJ domain-containing protein n=1 Tax=Selenihalanaerobacter shriftii TaxID=142842 RepID=A0A1T4JNL8_9FIRM|nr:bifunctional oligoribonuclease/PAP phosphatase NrnA [Selenihalanaerobacter shriftii]SJZ31748.1 phosphoesterase RecJ domain-containing protein [Selenihalanaerobacter shriftii]